MKPFSLYVHVPFCFYKCPYCDFNTYALAKIPEKEYVAALLSELDFYSSKPEWTGRPVQTIYFGGGTPSLFSVDSIKQIVSAIRNSFDATDLREAGLEANPGTITTEVFAGYRTAGIDRISLGTQSFSIATLKALGRMHSVEQNEAAVAAAREAGFKNISLDLIYGAPEQTVRSFREDLAAACALSPEHISAYILTIEKGTPFYVSYRKGLLKLPSEDEIIEMFEQAPSFLAAHGLSRYEISNFAKPGFAAAHNMAYWNGDDYLGLGAGAHSYAARGPLAGRRWSNYALPEKYIEIAVGLGDCSSWEDQLNAQDLAFEYFFLGLRKIAGVSLAGFEQRFGVSAREIYGEKLEQLLRYDLLTIEGDNLKLTAKGLLLSDSVVEEFAGPTRNKKLALATSAQGV